MTDNKYPYELYSMWENERGETVRRARLNRCTTLEKAVEVANAYNRDDIDIFYRSGTELLAVAWDK